MRFIVVCGLLMLLLLSVVDRCRLLFAVIWLLVVVICCMLCLVFVYLFVVVAVCCLFCCLFVFLSLLSLCFFVDVRRCFSLFFLRDVLLWVVVRCGSLFVV